MRGAQMPSFLFRQSFPTAAAMKPSHSKAALQSPSFGSVPPEVPEVYRGPQTLAQPPGPRIMGLRAINNFCEACGEAT